jgi:deazaflavin-dependent oxidoreductase (nitroreductase family)
MSSERPASAKSPSLPPPWFIRIAWAIHRAMYRITGGRRGLWKPKPGKWGTMKLTTVGRKTGKEREAILGYFEEGPNLVTMAMNGWMEAEPAWWLNLQANPVTRVETKDGTRKVRGRAATGDEHGRCGPSGPRSTPTSTATQPAAPAGRPS